MLASEAQLTRDEAIARLKAKRAFDLNLSVYSTISAALILIWMATRSTGDPFWPIWPIGLWGIGVLGQAWHLYGAGAEVRRRDQRGGRSKAATSTAGSPTYASRLASGIGSAVGVAAPSAVSAHSSIAATTSPASSAPPM
jgi:hypothetical protein